MSTVIGTGNGDFVHVAGDGETPPGGYNEIALATNNADTIDADDGDDIVYGGGGDDVITGGLGADKMYGGAGNDQFNFFNPAEVSVLHEIINGGAGDIDRIFLNIEAGLVDFSASEIKNVERLVIGNGSDEGLTLAFSADQLRGFDLIFFGYVGPLTIATAGNVDLQQVALSGPVTFVGSEISDTFIIPETLTPVAVHAEGGADTVIMKSTSNSKGVVYILDGGDGNDVLKAANGDNTILGGDGKDKLSGGRSADFLSGGVGHDRLVGGGGADTLTGGDGADRFILSKLKESRPGEDRGDTITDFNGVDGDRVDLSQIDADPFTAGDQAFHLGSSEFSHVVGELIQFSDGSSLILQGDVDGDGSADFSIELLNVAQLFGSDFIF